MVGSSLQDCGLAYAFMKLIGRNVEDSLSTELILDFGVYLETRIMEVKHCGLSASFNRNSSLAKKPLRHFHCIRTKSLPRTST